MKDSAIKKYTIGVDFGSDSVRAVLVDSDNGRELTSEVFWYPRWREGQYCDPSINQFRQHPLDHIEGMEYTIAHVVKKSKVNPSSVLGICVDTTGSSPLPLNEKGEALALTADFKDHPNAMMMLWKDHTAIKEAEDINILSKTWGGIDYTKYSGGIYSTEWFWAKILHIARTDDQVTMAAHTWMEHCDYMTYLLADHKDLKSFMRSRCAAGHKAMWHKSWNGLPPAEFLNLLHPYLAELRKNLYDVTFTSDQIAGNLNESWAKKLGLTTTTKIAVGTFDAHAGAVGAKVRSNALVRVMGTSTCDMIVSDEGEVKQETVAGICGQVDGSIIPEMLGLEAGQSAFGDVLAWFKSLLNWPIDNLVMGSELLDENLKRDLKKEIEEAFITKLTQQTEAISFDESIPLALDWVNGRRTPDANQHLKAAISRISLGTDAPRIFKALVNAICFGSKKIVDRFEEEGVAIKEVIGVGGVARKSPYIMQTLANVLNRPIKVASSDHAPALGAAIYAATAAGVYDSVSQAIDKMGSDIEAEYFPEPEKVARYLQAMQEYESLGDFIESKIPNN